MSEITATAKPRDEPAPPLTVAEIVAFQAPGNLAGWKLTQDAKGGYSFRATVGEIDYIATPRQWVGRSLNVTSNPGESSMQSFATSGAINGVTDLSTQTVGTMATNDPNIDRALVPRDVFSASSSVAPAAVVTGSTIHPAILIGAVLLLAFIVAAATGSATFILGRRTHGNS